MNKYLELFRLENGIIGIIGVVVTAFIAVGKDIVNFVPQIVICSVLVVLFIAGGNSLNDYIDREGDKISHPDRPLPSGRMEPKTALRLGIAALLLSFLCSLLLWNWVASLIVFIAIVLMVCYEVGLKQRGFVGNITIAALTGMVFLLGGSIVNNIASTVEVAGMAALVTVGREITKDIEDMEGDKDRYTLPMAIGKQKAGIIAAIFYIAGPILSLLPLIDGSFSKLYLTVLLADAIFIYCALILFSDPHKSQKMAKVAMLVALVAFILGVI